MLAPGKRAIGAGVTPSHSAGDPAGREVPCPTFLPTDPRVTPHQAPPCPARGNSPGPAPCYSTPAPWRGSRAAGEGCRGGRSPTTSRGPPRRSPAPRCACRRWGLPPIASPGSRRRGASEERTERAKRASEPGPVGTSMAGTARRRPRCACRHQRPSRGQAGTGSPRLDVASTGDPRPVAVTGTRPRRTPAHVPGTPTRSAPPGDHWGCFRSHTWRM
jgi:hypothetical protein